MLNNKRGSISLIGTPVSKFNCANAPFPVIISPIMENAIPNCANLPTNNSFAFVNPNNGPRSVSPKADLKDLPGGMTAFSRPVAGAGSSINLPLSPKAPMAPRRLNRMKNNRSGSAS
uniref:Putative ovule protein n=1 Tax=Solanum chacoense TaxID=4108 RepID=A0A0V0GSS3_SOLCH